MSSVLRCSEAQLTIFGEGASRSFSEEEGFLSVEDSWDSDNDTEDTGRVDVDRYIDTSAGSVDVDRYLDIYIDNLQVAGL